MEHFFLPREGRPIHSVREDFLFLHGSERDASTVQIVLAGVINLTLPINLLDGLSNSQLIVGFSSFGSFA
jgi:hypothetical protein